MLEGVGDHENIGSMFEDVYKEFPENLRRQSEQLAEEIKLNVIAFDEDGNFVSDVTEDDLVITENNVLHQARSVRRIPANVLIVMDTGGEMRQLKSLEQTRKAARGIVAALQEAAQLLDAFRVQGAQLRHDPSARLLRQRSTVR